MSTVIRKLMDATFTQETPRSFGVTLSTAGADREKDRLMVTGWKIPRHCPLLWGHDPSALPIGRVVNVSVLGDTLRGRIEFPPPGTYEFADTVVRLIDTGYLGSVSVGFRAVDQPQRNELGGFDFPGKKDLIELSVVNCPANIDAHIDGRQTAAMTKWLGGDVDVITLDDEVIGTKAGRVLSGQNEQHLQRADAAILEAQSRVRSVLASLPADDTDLIDVTADDADEQIDVAPREVAAAVASAIRASVADLVGRAAAKAISLARGRVWDEPLGDPATRRHRVVGGGEDIGLSRSDVTSILRSAIVDAIGDRGTLAAIVHRETERTLNRLRGRVE